MCLYLGARHPDQLLASLTSEQWAEWQLYSKHFPLPHLRSDINVGLLRYSILAPHVKGKIDVKKLMPIYGQPKRKRATAAETAQKWRAWSEAEAAREKNLAEARKQ